MYMDKEGMTLATEIVSELKASARRWFIAFIVMLIVEVFTVAGFLWYISLPADETITTQEAEDINNSSVIQRVGDYIEGTADGGSETAGSQTETEETVK